MTYYVLMGSLNHTHSLTHPPTLGDGGQVLQNMEQGTLVLMSLPKFVPVVCICAHGVVV